LFNLESDIAEAFRSSGLRRTPQRYAVLAYLMQSVHATPDEIPRNVYPDDIPRLHEQVKPLETYPVEIREGEIWVNLE